MRFSFYKTIINPVLPCHMEGYADRIATDIHDDLYLNTFVLQSHQTFVFHVYDLIMITEEFANRIKDETSKEFNMNPDCVFVSAIHTHSGPKVSTKLFPDILPDEEYLSGLVHKALSNTKMCLESLVNGRIQFGMEFQDGYYSNRNDKNAYFNKRIDVLKFLDDHENPCFSLCTIACHPTLMSPDSTEISADLFGYMREEFFRRNGYPLIILTAEAGDVSTRYTRKGHGPAEIERVGNALVSCIMGIVDFKDIELSDLCLNRIDYEFDYKPKDDSFIQQSLKKLQKLIDSSSNPDVKEAYLDMYRSVSSKYDKDLIQIKCTAFVLEGKDLRFVCFPGEIVSNLGLLLHGIDSKKTMIFAYCNDFKGYAIDELNYGKYAETFLSDYPFMEADRFVDRIVEGAGNEIY